MKKKLLFLLTALTMYFGANAQDAVSYQLPPKEIADLLLAKPTPDVSFDSEGEWMLQSERNSYPTVEELGQPEIRIAGLRLNPNNFSPSRQTFINNFILRNIKTGKDFPISGLPTNMLAGNVRWSLNEKKIAFTNTTNNQVDLYIIDVATKTATKVNKKALNVVLGADLTWFDDNTIVYKTAISTPSAIPTKPITPKGPTVQQNIGKAAPGRTYQDLIKTPYDEQLFEFMATAQMVINRGGVETPFGKPAIYESYSLSPDKKYFLVEVLKKPFSYLVPASGFPTTVSVIDVNGNLVKEIADLPSAETRPSGNDNLQNIPRGFDWRADEAATLVWAMPLDSGLIKKNVEYHDVVYAQAAPFKTEKQELFKTKMRFRGITWGNENFAWVTEALTGKQTFKVSRYNSSTKTVSPLFERNITDAYGNPGTPIMTKNSFGKQVILVENNKIFLNNTVGSSPKGDLPFLSLFDIDSKQTEQLWRCNEGTFEFVVDVLDSKNLKFITRKESKTEVPNFFIKNLKLRIADIPITSFANPYPALVGVTKQKVKYTRKDGIELTGDLYLPKNYNKEKDGALPVYLWAYPREFNSAADAAQVRGSENKFITISWGSPIYYVTQGFAVLDNAEMPIVSKGGDTKPNDNFIEQLTLNAEAAINHLAEMGVGDRNRIAAGGHSYGAFMTAHLLSHTKLFKAGIARSGAYNRTLTPFGFQAEDRTYWEAPDLYYKMSPFSYADKIKTPLLLIHGDSDDNPGTFPINSERMFAAIKGHGGTVRFVFLPYEAHGYRGKENLLHMLWEQNEWLKKYVKESK
ncbi:MAG: prolyl oligopeptidase family serine peptidase [Arcicella sp.]|jgi:dipeptidyl aminopeptidase/acylaminoacyl peptidase|nr:prolyl oligopeptidase family serine peptidase [Arcicella sp.]